MKFLCLECNTAMQFKEATAPDQGSLTAIFECPGCFAEIAMHMNPWETQMLKSLDVELGGKSEKAEPMQMIRSFLSQKKTGTPLTADTAQTAATPTNTGLMNQPATEGGKCPFTSVVAEAFQQEPEPESGDAVWTEEALQRLERIPSFVQSMAKAGIENYARENGHTEISGEVMEAARGNFGM